MPSNGLVSITSRIDVEPLNGLFRDTTRATAKAATRSIKTVSADIVKKGRADIRASGKFRGKWVSAFKSSVAPKGRNSNSATAYIRHAMGGLAAVHEFGATIKGKPLLWLPMTGQKKTTLGTDFATGRVSTLRVRATAANVSQAKGGLQYRKPGKYPQLGVVTGKGKRAKFKPLFIGIPVVKIKPKWHLTQIAKEGANALPGEFEKQLGEL